MQRSKSPGGGKEPTVQTLKHWNQHLTPENTLSSQKIPSCQDHPSRNGSSQAAGKEPGFLVRQRAVIPQALAAMSTVIPVWPCLTNIYINLYLFRDLDDSFTMIWKMVMYSTLKPTIRIGWLCLTSKVFLVHLVGEAQSWWSSQHLLCSQNRICSFLGNLNGLIYMHWTKEKKDKLMRNQTEHHSKIVMLDFSIPLIRSASQKMSKTSSPPGTRSLRDKQLAQLLQNALHFPQDTTKDITR